MIYCKYEDGEEFAISIPMCNTSHELFCVKDDGVYVFNLNNGKRERIKELLFEGFVLSIIGYEYKGTYYEYDKED